MATGDIIACEILDTLRHRGWVARVKIEGWSAATGLAMVNGFGANNSPTGAKVALAVTTEGLTIGLAATSTLRDLQGTVLVYKAEPDVSTLETLADGSDLWVYFAISEDIYATCTATATFLSGAFTSNLGSSSAASGVAVTNNATLDFPPPILQWFWGTDYAPRRFVGSTFKVAVVGGSGCGMVGVRFTATGLTSSATATQTVTAQTAHTFDNGMVVSIWEVTFDGSIFTQGEHISVDFVGVTIFGDVTLDSSDYAAEDTALNRHTIDLTCNKTGALTVYAAVDGVGGGTPATAATEAGARLTPYADLEDAMDATTSTTSELIIVVEEGTHALLGGTISALANTAHRTIRSATGTDPDAVILQFGASLQAFNTTYLRIYNLTIKGSTSNNVSMLNGSSVRNLWYDKCSFVKSTGTSGYSPGYTCLTTTFTDCDFDDIVFWKPAVESGRSAHRIFGGEWTNLGASFSMTGLYGICCVKMVAGDAPVFGERTVSASNPVQSNFVWINNAIYQVDNSSAQMVKFGVLTAQTGLFFCGGIGEKQNASTAGVFSIAADGSRVNCDNVVVVHMSLFGARFNAAYNQLSWSDPTVADADRLSRRHWWLVGNCMPQPNFNGHNAEGTRTVTAVGNSGGFAQFTTSSSATSILSATSPGQWFKITGTAGYNGWHRCTAITSTLVTSATAYGASEGSLSAVLNTKSAGQTGGWPMWYGVNQRHNATTDHDITTVRFEGLDWTENATPDVEDDQSTTGGNTGYGDYTPTYGGDLMGRLTTRRATYDMNGTLIRTGGLGDVGAIQHGYITLTAPADLATDQPSNPTFSWEAYALAGHYHLFYAPDGGVEVEVADIEATSQQVSGLDPSTLYTWYVIAHPIDDTHAAIANSETWEFTTRAASDGHSRTGLTLGLGLGL